MTSPNSTWLLLLGAVTSCAPSVASPTPQPLQFALDCAYRVVERHGFLAEWGTDGFPWRLPASNAHGFTVQRGEGPARETVSVSIVSDPASGAVEASAWGDAAWVNAGTTIRATSSAAEDVAHRVHEECSVPGRAV